MTTTTTERWNPARRTWVAVSTWYEFDAEDGDQPELVDLCDSCVAALTDRHPGVLCYELAEVGDGTRTCGECKRSDNAK